MNVRRIFFLLALLAVWTVPGPVQAQSSSFQSWVNGLWPQARAKGVSRATFKRAFKGVTLDQSVLDAASKQPEFTKAIWEYLSTAVSQRRIDNGRAKLVEQGKVLKKIQRRYGVDRHIVLAIWGMETAYGGFTGNKNTIRSLATLAYKGRRRRFGRQQLLAALQILQNGDVTPEKMEGSWAGAMGHTQFIPTTFRKYAVDYNRDGKRDIWGTIPDALASTAHYLKKMKWQRGAPWGYEVVLPKGFNYSRAVMRITKPTAEWVARGVRRVNGKKFGAWARPAAIILPAGAKGPAFMVFRNFRVIMRYNHSVSYALAVGLLSQRIQGRGHIKAAWPVSDRPLNVTQKRELQQRLAQAGYYRGTVDGRIGSGTRRALRKYQRRQGVAPDGYPSLVILRRLRGDG